MTDFSKSIVLFSVVTCALLTVLAWVCVRGAVVQRQSYQGYFAPVYSPDGQYVYFVERRTNGTAKETVTEDFFFRSSKFDVFVAKDTFSLKGFTSRAAKSKSSFASRRRRLRGGVMKESEVLSRFLTPD